MDSNNHESSEKIYWTPNLFGEQVSKSIKKKVITLNHDQLYYKNEFKYSESREFKKSSILNSTSSFSCEEHKFEKKN